MNSLPESQRKLAEDGMSVDTEQDEERKTVPDTPPEASRKTNLLYHRVVAERIFGTYPDSALPLWFVTRLTKVCTAHIFPENS